MTLMQPKRRRLTPEARRSEILDTAARLLSERGYNGVTIQEVADASGMAKSGVLHHFPNKINLLIELLKDRHEQHLSEAELRTLPLLGQEESRQLLDRVVASNFERREIVKLFTVLGIEALDPAHPAHEYFTHRLESTYRMMRDAAEGFHPSPESAALRTIAFLDGLQLLWLRDESIDFLGLWADFADRLFTE